MDYLKPELHKKLRLEAIQRTHIGSFYQTIIFASVLAWLYETVLTDKVLITLSTLSFLVLFTRMGTIFWARKTNKVDQFFTFYMTLICLNSLVYGLMCSYLVSVNKELSEPVIIFFYFCTGMLTAAISNLAPTPIYQFAYLISLTTPVFVTLIQPGVNSLYYHIGTLYGIYVLFLFSVGRVMNKDLLKTYETADTFQSMSEQFRSVIDLVPGFVGLSDNSGIWKIKSDSFSIFENNEKFLSEFENFKKSKNIQTTKEIAWADNKIEHHFIVSFLKSFDGSIIAVGIEADEMISMRRELEFQRAKSEHSARLATLGEMAGGIAHEINNPLAVVVGNSSRLQNLITKEPPDIQKALECLNKITQTSFRISKIVAGLRKFSRQNEDEEFLYTPFAKVIEETFELCREKLINRGIELSVEPLPDVELPIQAIQMSQVIMNLLNNAVDAVANSSEKKICIWSEKTEDYFILNISDSGSGINKENVLKIFDPFFTTKDVGEGTGLGLSISKSIILDHQGELSLTRPNSPTTFTIKLPFYRTEKGSISSAS